jgi:hypothetical protein
LKCGAVKQAIKSTDMNKAYHEEGKLPSHATTKYSALHAALMPQPNSTLKLLRIIVTASVATAKGARGVPDVSVGSNCLEYFLRCDSAQTELLFGKKFQKLLDAVRNEKQSLSKLYNDLYGN